VSALQMAAAEKQRIFATIQRWARRAPNPIAKLVAGNRAEDAGDEQPAKRNYILPRENAGSDKQGIARQKKSNEESCLNKNDGANQAGATPTDQLFKPFRVVEGVQEVANGFQQAVSFLAEMGIGVSARERKCK
jgi:hypothetical protein